MNSFVMVGHVLFPWLKLFQDSAFENRVSYNILTCTATTSKVVEFFHAGFSCYVKTVQVYGLHDLKKINCFELDLGLWVASVPEGVAKGALWCVAYWLWLIYG